mmetsp:Transcript_10309/g.15073  ORF Transcript_10309/g.15073 Transcript_10309/m.15073 type:complete len:424 (-) Transcript_10309:36-1307(-)
MTYVDFTGKGMEEIEKGKIAQREKNYEKARSCFMAAANQFLIGKKHTKDPTMKKNLEEKAEVLLKQVEQLDALINNPEPEKNSKNSEDAENDKMKEALSETVLVEKPNVKWDDVAGLEPVKELLKDTVYMPALFPHLFSGKRKAWRGVLLYGPPGTGKSYLAKAVATESNGTFYSLSSSDLVSKWQGESERLIKQLFSMARENKPSVIFIDECDSLLSKRTDNENEATRRIKTEFITQLDGVGTNNEGVLFLGATNKPWDLDEAGRRRLERRVYIPLPDTEAREALFKLNIGKTPHVITETDIAELAKRTDGYSGADISILTRTALMEPVRTLQLAQHFKTVSGPDPTNPSQIRNDLLTPCPPNEPRGIEMTIMDVPADRLSEPPVSFRDFERAMRMVRPSVSHNDLGRYQDWTKKYGQDGSV